MTVKQIISEIEKLDFTIEEMREINDVLVSYIKVRLKATSDLQPITEGTKVFVLHPAYVGEKYIVKSIKGSRVIVNEVGKEEPTYNVDVEMLEAIYQYPEWIK
jgi:hypothetical protein